MIITQDLMETDTFPDYDLIFTDPPWGEGMTKFFQTLLKKNTGIVKTHKYEDLAQKFASLADTSKPIFIDWGVGEYVQNILTPMITNGHYLRKIYQVRQSNGAPGILISFNTDWDLPELKKGFGNIGTVVEHFSPCTVFDPFAGLGKTGSAVVRAGGKYIGHELNPKRAKRGDDLLKKIQKTK